MFKGLLGNRRLVLLAAAAAVAVAAVAIPAASGRTVNPKTHPQLQNRASFVVGRSLKAIRMLPRTSSATCHGGSITPGTYTTLKIDGFCTIDLGPVMVQHNVTITGDGELLAAFGDNEASLVVGGNLNVQQYGVLLLGCDPANFECLDDNTALSKSSIYGSLNTQGALAVIVHDTTIAHDLNVNGDGGGYNCNTYEQLDGGPAYDTFEDVSVGGSATIQNLNTCWFGLIRTSVAHDVSFHDNSTFDQDGNELVTDTVKHNLGCYDNSPNAQFGDSSGNADLVLGTASGECSSLVWTPGP